MKISIVTSYFNRKNLFLNTLKTILNTKHNDFEIVVVDDGSSAEHRLEDLEEKYDFLKVVRVESKDKWYVNPCVPFNLGIKKAVGNVIIIQNPECLHVHDVLSHVANEINDEKYITISAYATNQLTTKKMNESLENNNLINFFNELPQQSSAGGQTNGWYNHSRYRPVFYHFCSAISRNNLEKLNGFDERYAMGIAYDDNEFIERIKRLGLKLIISDDVSVIHQWHPTVFYNKNNVRNLQQINKNMFFNVTKRENIIKVN